MFGKGLKRILKWLWQSAMFAFYTTSLAIHAVDNRHGDTLSKKLARVWYSNLKIGLLQLVSAFLCYAHWRVLRPLGNPCHHGATSAKRVDCVETRLDTERR